MLKAAAVAPQAVRADANNLWSEADDAIRFLASLEYGFGALEEPLKAGDHAGMDRIAARSGCSIILDESLLRALPRAGELARGFGIPSGGGALYHPDYSLEPVRQTLTEVEATENGVRQAMLFPGGEPGGEPGDETGERAPRVMSQEEIVDRALRDLGAPGDDSGDPVN